MATEPDTTARTLGYLEGRITEQAAAIQDVRHDLAGLRQEVNTGFQEGRQELRDEIQAVRQEMKDGFQELRQEMKEEIQAVRQEMKDGFQELRQEMKDGFQELRQETRDVLQEVNRRIDRMYLATWAIGGGIIASLVVLIVRSG